MTQNDLDADTQAALAAARVLVAAGVPLFLATPNPESPLGYTLPARWQLTEPDPAVVDRWRPGLALGAVMGRGLDLVDIDPRNGGDPALLGGTMPRVYAAATTPSGGLHSFVAPLGVGSRDTTFPGIDVKAGAPDGTGRGYAFIAPTVRISKVSHEPAGYRWITPPDPATLAQRGDDASGAPLAARIRELRANSNALRRIAGPDWWVKLLTNQEPQSAQAAARAVEDKLREVREAPAEGGAGFRDVLLRAALTLGGYVGGGWLDEQDARDRLEEAVAEVWGAPDANDRLWIQQGLDDGAVMPFHVYTAADAAAYSENAITAAAQGEDPPPGADNADTADPAAAPPGPPTWNVWSGLGAGEPFDPAGDGSDQGLAKAVAFRSFGVLRYAGDAGLWVKREPEVWTEHGDDLSGWIVSALAELMPLGQTPIPKDLGERTEGHWQAHRRALFTSSAGAGRISRKLKEIVRSDHPSTIKLTDLDTNPEILWAGGLPWDLRASGERPGVADWVDPATPHLRSALCAPDADCPTPRFDAFLAVVLPDPELRAWALRVLSIALTGYADAALPVLYGRERSGKTSLIEMLVTVLGSYAHAASAKLLAPQDNGHEVIVYDLKGRRLAFIDEGPRRGHDATERLKQLTGGGSLTARPMRANPITFRPTHTLVMTTNNPPAMVDPALRARLRLIPCDAPEDEVRPARVALLGHALRAEAPGILAAMMREAAAYLDDRDSAGHAAAPEFVRLLGAEMAAEQDPVRDWQETCTVPSEPGTRAHQLYTQFAAWHQDHPLYKRLTVPTEAAWGRSLTEAGFPATRLRDGKYRPLSVLGGPGAGAVPPPGPAEFMRNASLGQTAQSLAPGTSMETGDHDRSHTENSEHGAVHGSMHGSCTVGDEPYTADRRRSDPVFEESVYSVNGYTPQNNTQSNNTEIVENTGVMGAQPLTVHTSAQETPLTCENGPVYSSPSVHNQSDAENSYKSGTGAGAAGTSVSPRNVNPSATAAKAAADKSTKAEARRKLAEEKRRAAVAEVSGPHYDLPAVVDRTGRVIAIDVDLAASVLTSVNAAGPLTVDVETSGYPVGHKHYRLRSVQLGNDGGAVVLDPHDGPQRAVIATALAAAQALHAHSATADLAPLDAAGLVDPESAWARMFDTVIAAKLADPASTGSDPGLKQLAGTMLGADAVAPAADEARSAVFKAGKWLTNVDPAATPPERSGWAQIDTGSEVMLRYAASDVLDTGRLARLLPSPSPRVLDRERLAQRMTARVTHRGVRLDPEQIALLSLTHRMALNSGRRTIQGRWSIDNPGSTAQIGAALETLGANLPRTGTGKPSVTAAVLKGLAEVEGTDAAELATAVLDYRHHETVLGLFLDPYNELVGNGDGRARPTVYTLGTDTGRMSCVRPNLQQLPREGGVRACMTADDGYVLASADFSSVELRVAAALSGDATLAHLIAEEDAGRGDGLHWQVARQVWGPEATKANRYVAKRAVFGRLYGAGIPGVAKAVGVSEAVAEQVVNALDAVTPGLAQWSAQLSNSVRRGQRTFETYSGRVIHLDPGTPHKAPNYAIQGSARELLVDALIAWDQTPWRDATLYPVHDELVVAVPEADADAATAALLDAMTSTLNGVAIKAEADPATRHWADSA